MSPAQNSVCWVPPPSPEVVIWDASSFEVTGGKKSSGMGDASEETNFPRLLLRDAGWERGGIEGEVAWQSLKGVSSSFGCAVNHVI